jgi:hypothetical protein
LIHKNESLHFVIVNKGTWKLRRLKAVEPYLWNGRKPCYEGRWWMVEEVKVKGPQ